MSQVQECIDDLKAKLMDIPEFKQKVFYVYSEDDMSDRLRGLTFPAVGILYESTQVKEDGTRMGMSAEITCAIAIMVSGKVVAGLDAKNEAAGILDLARKGIRMQDAPTGHKWSFRMESCAGALNGAIVYIQRWTTSIILTN